MSGPETGDSAGGPANPWRSETVIPLADGDFRLRCTMDILARLFEAAGAGTLLDLYRAWDSHHPDVMRACFRLLATSPAAADKVWPNLCGIRDLAEIRLGFYRVTSGKTPEEIREAEEAVKKAGGALAMTQAAPI